MIADEPTSALDVVTQRQVMQTLAGIQARTATSLILIGHDMGLMAQFVDELTVMRAGRVVESGPMRRAFTAPRHDYTRALIESVPSLRRQTRKIAARIAAQSSVSAAYDSPTSRCRKSATPVPITAIA